MERISNFVDLCCVTFSVHNHCNQHFTNTDHPSGWMRVLYFTGPQVLRVLFKEPAHTGTRCFKLLCGFCQRSTATAWLCAFRRLHLVGAVGNHVQKRMFTVRRIGGTRCALGADQPELYTLGVCEVLNRIKDRPAA